MTNRYQCQCGNPIFFRNTTCLKCETPLGYDYELGVLIPLKIGQAPDTWERHEVAPQPASDLSAPPPIQASTAYRRCANLASSAACNWLINANQPMGNTLCLACSLNRTIPDLTDPAHPENAVYWGRIELAKRRMLAGVLRLGLQVVPKFQDLEHGLAFDLVSDQPGAEAVLTGHDTGLITLNVKEADDAARESIRSAMQEPYRTLLGHFRHEIGHYFWDVLIKNSTRLNDFRQLFGDETQDYAASLQQNYSSGPPENWKMNYISSYASSHPWEDWAETWAHYLHMRATLETAADFGLVVNVELLEFAAFTSAVLAEPNDATATPFLAFLNQWTALTVLLNDMNRSMGQADFYPFALPVPAVSKLHFVHMVIDAANQLQPPPPPPPSLQPELQSQSQSQSQSQAQTQPL